MENKNKACLILLCILIFTSFLTGESRLKKEGDALAQLYKTKLQRNSIIDTSLFQAIEFDAVAKVLPQEGLKEKDKVKALPGQPPVEFDQYGGYVTIDQSSGRAFYYYFAEAQHSKNTLPLLLWLNGGMLMISIVELLLFWGNVNALA